MSQRFGPWGALVRGGHVPRGGGYGVMSEGLDGLWLAAEADPRMADLREPIAERAICNAGLAVSAQSDRRDAARLRPAGRVEGAWFRDGETRMDDQQHALAGAAAHDPDRPGSARPAGAATTTPRRAGSGRPRWCWRSTRRGRAFAMPRAGRSRRTVAGLAAVGGAIGGLAVCAAASVADPLLDALDVSDPSFRIAAGVVARIAGAPTCSGGRPAPEPALPGRRAALVPVAMPVVARPALLVLALGAGADRGVLLSAGAMASACRAARARGCGGHERPRAAGRCAGRAGCWPPA